MDAGLNSTNENATPYLGGNDEKSELMQFFEYHVNDAYWAYKDLVKALLELDQTNDQAAA